MLLKRKSFLFILLFILVGLAGCSREKAGSAPPNPNVVASFNGGMITKDQLKARLDDLMPCCKERYQGKEGTKALLKEMVLPTVISQAIKQKKIDLRENIREEMGNLTEELNMSFLHMKFHEQILNADEKYKDLKENYEYQKRILEGSPLSERYNKLVQLHGQIHPQIAEEVEKVAEEYVQKLHREASITTHYDVLKVKVMAEELKDFYQRHKEGFHGDEYRIPEKVKVQEIVIKEDCPTCPAEGKQKTAEGQQEAREKAESALIELRSGAEFRTVAEKYASDAPETIQSKWYVRESDGNEFDEAIFSLDVGEISEVLKKEEAFYIVKVLEKQPGRFKAYEEIVEEITREYRWQKAEEYLEENKDRILFTLNAKPYTIDDLMKEYTRTTPPHQCHHMEGMHQEMQMDHQAQMGHQAQMEEVPQLCDFAHNTFEEQKELVDRMIDRELIVEDTYSQMIHVEHQEEIEFLTMASLYPLFHQEEMENLIHITDEMVAEHYEKNKQNYQYPATAKIGMIVIMGGETEEEKNRAIEKASQAYKELKPSFFSFKKGRDFAEVAREYSEDEETAYRGGHLEIDVAECRNQLEYVLLHGFHSQIFHLQPGDISNIFEFAGDYYIVQIREMESRKQIGFEEVREQVKMELMDQEHQQVMGKWEDDLLKSAGFAVYDQILKEALVEENFKGA